MPPSAVTVTIPVPGSRLRWLVAGLVVGLIAAGLAGPALGPRSAFATDPSATPADHTISVSGTGSVLISPDVADLRLGVTTQAKNVASARSANAKAMTAVIASLKKLGIADADIQTTTLSLSPTYDYSTSTNPPRLTGYTLSNAVAVTVRHLDVLGDAIDNALAAGANSLDSVAFRASDQAGAERQARDAAMAEAKAKAQTLASAAGVAITGVASISETVAPVPYPIVYGNAYGAAARDVATPVQAGTTDVSITVAVVYLIG